jgi:hypothetical protein
MSLTILFSGSSIGEQNWYPASDLIGGGIGALDAIDGSDLNEGDRAIVITSDSVYFYTLNSTSGASESSPDTISPDENAGDKRWILSQSLIPVTS